MSVSIKPRLALMAAALMVLVSACEDTKAVYPSKNERDTRPTWSDEPRESVFGPGGLSLFGGGKKGADEGGAGIGVNAFLWRASLDTLSFMPFSSADPFGGVIITDWYQPPESPGERFKMTIFILDRTLRADGVRVSLFRQIQDSKGQWIDQEVDKQTATDLENTILTRARELRTAQNAQQQ